MNEAKWAPLEDEEERACARCGLRTRVVAARDKPEKIVVILTGGYPGAELTGPRQHAGFGPRCPECSRQKPRVVAARPVPRPKPDLDLDVPFDSSVPFDMGAPPDGPALP